jgi:hypothetical protein
MQPVVNLMLTAVALCTLLTHQCNSVTSLDLKAEAFTLAAATATVHRLQRPAWVGEQHVAERDSTCKHCRRSAALTEGVNGQWRVTNGEEAYSCLLPGLLCLRVQRDVANAVGAWQQSCLKARVSSSVQCAVHLVIACFDTLMHAQFTETSMSTYGMSITACTKSSAYQCALKTCTALRHAC